MNTTSFSQPIANGSLPTHRPSYANSGNVLGEPITSQSVVQQSASFTPVPSLPPNQALFSQPSSFSQTSLNSLPAPSLPQGSQLGPTVFTGYSQTGATTSGILPAPGSLSQPTFVPGTTTPMTGLSAGAPLPPGTNLGLPDSDLELKKRMLDKHRDLKMKEVEMETNKEKKLEEKADKQREKAVKWVARGSQNFAKRHTVKADNLEREAHDHHMKAEAYKLEARALELERKQYDPPKEEKKPAATTKSTTTSAKPAPSAAPAKSTTTTTKTEEVKDNAGNTQQQQQQQTTQKSSSMFQHPSSFIAPRNNATSTTTTTSTSSDNNQQFIKPQDPLMTAQQQQPALGTGTQ